MQRTLVFGVIGAVLLATAVAIRIQDSPYIEYARGYPDRALEGLSKKARNGDGFAAFLVASSYRNGQGAPHDDVAAEDWYRTSVREGEVRALAPLIDVLVQRDPAPDRCRAALSLLDRAARTGEANAMIILGRYYANGFCTETDLITAARYALGAERIDRRYGTLFDQIATKIEPEQAAQLTPLPEAFDLKVTAALAPFRDGDGALFAPTSQKIP